MNPSNPKVPSGRTLLVLGAGASRAVSYNHEGRIPSPLDGDFRDLLSRLNKIPGKSLENDIREVIRLLGGLPLHLQKSMERSFYTLHLRALMSKTLGVKSDQSESDIVRLFARVIGALLRDAHGKRVCKKHQVLFERLKQSDCIILFNYDLVPERVFKSIRDDSPWGDWVYARKAPKPNYRFPPLFKLHGSMNWRRDGEKLPINTKAWSDFEKAYGYAAHSHGSGTDFPIFLPFWDKRIEKNPWKEIWVNAFNRAKGSRNVIVWGYSLPHTDIKSERFFDLALKSGEAVHLCVIDPSNSTKDRWRETLPMASWYSYDSFEKFESDPPEWWTSKD